MAQPREKEKNLSRSSKVLKLHEITSLRINYTKTLQKTLSHNQTFMVIAPTAWNSKGNSCPTNRASSFRPKNNWLSSDSAQKVIEPFIACNGKNLQRPTVHPISNGASQKKNTNGFFMAWLIAGAKSGPKRHQVMSTVKRSFALSVVECR